MSRNERRVTSAEMSTKQMARTVRDGRKVTFTFGFTNVTGYLCGMDDYHWMVITPAGDKHMIHKGQVPLISFAPELTYDSESNLRVLEKVVGPFRSRLVELGLTPGPRAVPATPEGMTA